MRLHLGLRDLLKFLKIGANITEAVQVKDIVTMED